MEFSGLREPDPVKAQLEAASLRLSGLPFQLPCSVFLHESCHGGGVGQNHGVMGGLA